MEVKVNSDEWKGLSKKDLDKIQAIIASHFRDVKIAPDTKSSRLWRPYLNRAPLASIRQAAVYRGARSCRSRGRCRLRVAIRLIDPICVAAAHKAGDLCRSSASAALDVGLEFRGGRRGATLDCPRRGDGFPVGRPLMPSCFVQWDAAEDGVGMLHAVADDADAAMRADRGERGDGAFE